MTGSGLLSGAARHVQAADQLAALRDRMSMRPAVMIRVLQHCTNAMELASEALVGNRESESMGAARAKYERAKALLAQHTTAHTIFERNGNLVMASGDYSPMDSLEPEIMLDTLDAAKEFVYEAGKQVVLGR